MKNPSHPGVGVRHDLEELGWHIADAAVALGVTRRYLAALVEGKAAITPEMALRLERGIGGTADTWLRMQAAYDLAQARMWASAIKVKKLAPRVL